jgi:hypothetical protein
MPAPRAPGAVFLSKNQLRTLQNRNNAQQEARYAPPAFQRLYTVDAVVPTTTGALVVADTDVPKWRYTKIKGVSNGLLFDTATHGYSTTGAAIRSLVCAICEYELNGTFLRMREVARSAVVSGMGAGYRFPGPVALDPQKNYAIANHILFASGPATSSFQASDESASVITKEDATGANPSFDWELSQGSAGGLDVGSSNPIAYGFYARGNIPDFVVRTWY